jgi:hypothetical protein
MSASSLPFPPFTENTYTASNPRASSAFSKLPISLIRLFALLDETESQEDDYGRVGPTQFAFRTACLMVAGAISLLDEDLPCAPVVDSEGGIRITWNRYHKQIKLICPATKESPVYIYQASPTGNSVRDRNVNASVLAERLSWLTSRESESAAAD